MRPALAILVAVSMASCARCDGGEDSPRSRRAGRSAVEDRPHPRLRDLPIEPFWQGDGGACPEGAELSGSPPPEGNMVRCERDGRPHGPYAAWHRGGRLWKSGAFSVGRRDGTWTFWSPGGEKVRQHTLVGGKLHGTASRWSSAGAPVEERTYDSGRLQRAVYYEGGEAVDVTAREQAAERCRGGDQTSCEQACEGLESPIPAEAPDGGALPSRLRGDGALSILDARLPDTISVGDTFEMVVRFLVEEPTSRPWKVSVVFEGDGARFSADHDPACPTTMWPAGTIVTDRFRVVADDDLRTPREGTYRALVGLFGVVDGEWQTLAPDTADSAWRVGVGSLRLRPARR